MRSFRRVIESDLDVESVFGVVSGEQWAAQRAAHLGDDSRLISRVETPEGGITMVVSRALPAGAPGFLKKFLPPDPRVITTDVWGVAAGGIRRATWSAEIAGTPALLRGTMTIEPTATGNRYTVEGEVKVSVPLVGGKAESYIAEQVARLVDTEIALVAKVLT